MQASTPAQQNQRNKNPRSHPSGNPQLMVFIGVESRLLPSVNGKPPEHLQTTGLKQQTEAKFHLPKGPRNQRRTFWSHKHRPRKLGHSRSIRFWSALTSRVDSPKQSDLLPLKWSKPKVTEVRHETKTISRTLDVEPPYTFIRWTPALISGKPPVPWEESKGSVRPDATFIRGWGWTPSATKLKSKECVVWCSVP